MKLDVAWPYYMDGGVNPSTISPFRPSSSRGGGRGMVRALSARHCSLLRRILPPAQGIQCLRHRTPDSRPDHPTTPGESKSKSNSWPGSSFVPEGHGAPAQAENSRACEERELGTRHVAASLPAASDPSFAPERTGKTRRGGRERE
jgi:hypothetical protein